MWIIKNKDNVAIDTESKNKIQLINTYDGDNPKEIYKITVYMIFKNVHTQMTLKKEDLEKINNKWKFDLNMLIKFMEYIEEIYDVLIENELRDLLFDFIEKRG